MKAYVSLHTESPIAQLDHEVSYVGYKRMPVDFEEGFGNQPVRMAFPTIMNDSEDVIKCVAVGPCENGQGEIFMRVPLMPYIPVKIHPERLTESFWIQNGANPDQAKELVKMHGYITPNVCIGNTDPIVIPDTVHPIAKAAVNLVYAGLMDTDDLHPKLFESINDELAKCGVPILTVKRGSSFKMDQPISKMKSLTQMMGNA